MATLICFAVSFGMEELLRKSRLGVTAKEELTSALTHGRRLPKRGGECGFRAMIEVFS
jgi:hypothetical protein